MMKNKIANEKCLDSSVDNTTTDNRSDHLISELRSSPLSNNSSKQAKLPLGTLKQSSSSETTTTTPSSKAPPSLSTTSSTTSAASTHHAFTRSRSKSSVSYAETSKGFSKTNTVKSPNVVANSDAVKHFNPASSTNISSSFRNALQMPQIAQVFPNLNIPNMSSLPDYLPQLPSVSMPSMPAMPNISLTMPSIPSLSMPSMPNLSMPNISMPSISSISNINIPSISEIMNFPIRKNIKTWNQICTSVRDSRKRFNDVCPSLPFNFNFRYDYNNEKMRIYFLSSQNSSETTLFYCDAPLVKQINGLDRSNGTIFEIEEDIMNKMRSDIQASEEAMQTGENDYESVDIGNESDEYRNYYDMDHNMSSKSSSLPSLSSSPSSGSYSHDPSLYRKTVASPTSSMTNFPTLSWKPLIMMNRAYFASNDDNTDFIQSGKQGKTDDRSPNKSTSSHEEDLILQRKRILYNGVISYDFHPGAARFVFTIKNMIYWFDDLEIASQSNCDTSLTSESNPSDESLPDLNVPRSHLRMGEKLPTPPPYIPHKLMTNTHVKMNATICPNNPDVVAYLADNDLWVCDLVSCKEMRLTTTDYSKTGIMAGRPSFVMQEEFSRFNGFWWGPTSPNDSDCQNFTILCEFVDESEVEVCSISSWDGTSEFHRFPKAGCPNAKSSLKLINFQLNDLKTLSKANNNNRDKVVVKDLPVNFVDLFPEYEYLVRCGWHSWDVVWVQLLNRRQNKLVIVLVSVNFYFPPQIIHEESRENHWYNCHDILYFFAQNEEKSLECCYTKPDSIVQFLWASEFSGFRHLYKISVKILGNFAPPTVVIEDNDEGKSDSESSKLNSSDKAFFETIRNSQPTASKAMLISNHQITNGNWEVFESLFWVDEQKDLIYFLGNKDSPLETHLYVVSSSSSPRVQPRRLTKEDFTHSRVFFDPEFRFCIDFQSNLTMPPFGLFHEVVTPEHASHSVNLEPLYYFLGLSEDVSFDESLEYQDKVQYLGLTPQLFEYKLKSGELVYGFLFKPDFMEPGAKYPVLLEIYGGPEVQLVNKSFRDIRQHRRHLIASEGYVVVGFDSRGSKYRGVEFERHIYKRLGQVEILDQVEALEWLAENTGFMDMSRVAIHGWSYGGYLSLMALAQRPDIFKCAIAGAPVTNWLLYDTGYTERYMGLPEENEEGYRLSSVLSYSKHFPNEYNRLLIIHGLMDENVHFAHTAHLIHSLVTQGKPYHLNVFPFERHSLRKLYSSEHYEATLLQYLQQNL